jgi:4-aminobutyrate aminotransferase
MTSAQIPALAEGSAPRRPVLRTELPGPKAKAIISRSSAAVSTSYTRDYPLVADRGEGCWVIDPDENEFLDLTSGIAVCSTGHCHPTVVKAIQEQAARLIHMSGTDFYYPAQSALADRVSKLGSVKGDKHRVYFGNSGTEANEAALKLARWKTGRTGILGFLGSFHGRAMGSLSVTSSRSVQRARFGPLVPGVYHALYPDPLRQGPEATRLALDHIELLFQKLITPEELAAILVEPIQGEGGYVIPPTDFLQGLRDICDRHGILLIFDEVQSGMGRTGKMFAWQHTGVKPDIISLAKGIASGMPLSAMIARDEIMCWPPGAHASTFGGNPIACAAAAATLDLLEGTDGEPGLIENAATVGPLFQDMLRSAVGDHPRVAEVRGRGLMIGVELVQDRQSLRRDDTLRNEVVTRCFEKGLLILGCGPNSIRFAPGLCLTADEAQVATGIFAAALRECAIEHPAPSV